MQVLQNDLIGCDSKPERHSIFQGEIILLMADRKIKANRKIIGLHSFQYDVIQRAAKFFAGIVRLYLKTTHDQALQASQLTSTLQVPEHAIDAIKVFARVFHKKYFSYGVD